MILTHSLKHHRQVNMIKMIVCVDKNCGIGYKNTLPWSCKEDLQYFKNCTSGKSVLMGKNTFESLPYSTGLPNRKNYVLTSNKSCVDFNNVSYLHEITDNFINKFSRDKHKDLWIVGGAKVYEKLFEK